jgi:hypothetical protein
LPCHRLELASEDQIMSELQGRNNFTKKLLKNKALDPFLNIIFCTYSKRNLRL